MPKTITITVYSFDELSDKAKARAIEEVRKLGFCSVESGEIEDVFKGKLEDYGYPTEDIRFRLSYSQGDGMAFYGDFDPKPVLERLGLNDDGVSGSNCWTIKRNSYGHQYSHYNTMDLEAGDDSVRVQTISAVLEDIVKVSKELEKLGYSMIEDSDSDENIRDHIVGNGDYFWFLENGKLYKE